MKKGCQYGVHRVIEPKDSLPQAAIKIDHTPEYLYSNEVLIDVQTLNIDSASFTQIKQACGHDKEKMKQMILDIVNERGKMQNPVTGSGGMLIGTVKQIGPDFNDSNLKVGDKIATLVSLSLTPLYIKEITDINIQNDQVSVEATAILFESGIYSILPDDLPETLALAALDVAGAPAQVNKLVKQDDTVVIIGAAGKSGILCTYQAMKNAGPNGNVIAVVINEDQKHLLESMKLATHVVIADATKPTDVYDKIVAITKGERADVTINVVNVENTEMACILSTKDTGIVYFFSMATSFTKAALGAEGIGSDVTMIIGNGYTKNHANLTLDIIRESKVIRELFEKLYV